MNKDSNPYFKTLNSPGVPFTKHQFSPIITMEKYQLISRKHYGFTHVNMMPLMESEIKRNQSTPRFKLETDQNSNEGIRPMIKTNNSIFDSITYHGESRGETSTFQCFTDGTYHHSFSTSLKRVDSDICNSESNKHSFNSDELADSARSYEFIKRKKNPTCTNKIKTKVEDYKNKVFRLDEILINGKFVRFLPYDIDSMFDEKDEPIHNCDSYVSKELLVRLIKPLYEKNFYRLNRKKLILDEKTESKNKYDSEDKLHLNVISADQKEYKEIKEKKIIRESIQSKEFKILFKKEISKKNEIFNSEKLLKETPIHIYEIFLDEFKQSLIQIQNVYLNNRTKRIPNRLIVKADRFLSKLNEIYEIFLICVRNVNMIKKKSNTFAKSTCHNKYYNNQSYVCDFCNKQFDSGQGLGGHMSRMHPNKSEKYKLKMKVRNSRVEMRELIYESKKKILAENGYDYIKLKRLGDKKTINKIILTNIQEYKSLLKTLKVEQQKKLFEKKFKSKRNYKKQFTNSV